jgi:hypothetical protein
MQHMAAGSSGVSWKNPLLQKDYYVDITHKRAVFADFINYEQQ